MSSQNFLQQVSDNILECCLCIDRYESPKLLPCGHSFCKDCIKQHIRCERHEYDHTFRCPVCITTHSSDVNLIDNYALNDMLEHVSTFQEVLQCCSFCKTAALYICNQCEDLYCGNCFQRHEEHVEHLMHKTELLSQSEDLSLNQIKTLNYELCHVHGRLKKIFCIEKKIAVCKTCGNLPKYTNEHFVFLGQYVKQKIEETKTITMHHLETHQREVENAMYTIQHQRDDIKKKMKQSIIPIENNLATLKMNIQDKRKAELRLTQPLLKSCEDELVNINQLKNEVGHLDGISNKFALEFIDNFTVKVVKFSTSKKFSNMIKTPKQIEPSPWFTPATLRYYSGVNNHDHKTRFFPCAVLGIHFGFTIFITMAYFIINSFQLPFFSLLLYLLFTFVSSFITSLYLPLHNFVDVLVDIIAAKVIQTFFPVMYRSTALQRIKAYKPNLMFSFTYSLSSLYYGIFIMCFFIVPFYLKQDQVTLK